MLVFPAHRVTIIGVPHAPDGKGEQPVEGEEAYESFGESLDPWGGPDAPDPDADPAGHNRYHGYCGTCSGGELLVQSGDDPEDTTYVTCFACGGSGQAEDEKLCPFCCGYGCAECGESGYSVDCPYDPPLAFYWTDPWTRKRTRTSLTKEN